MKTQFPLADIPIITHPYDEVPLAVIHIFPLINSSRPSKRSSLCLPAPLVKLYLLKQSKRICIRWDSINDGWIDDHDDKLAAYSCRTQIASGTMYSKDFESSQHDLGRVTPIFIFPSQDPTETEGVPCILRGYTARYLSRGHSLKGRELKLDDDLLCHVLPPLEVANIDMDSHTCDMYDLVGKSQFIYSALKENLIGLTNISDSYCDKSLLLSFEKEVVEELTIRMKMLLERKIRIGTTSDSVECWYQKKNYRRRLRALFHRQGEDDSSDSNFKAGFILNNAALVIHDPVPGSGKTTLAATISKYILNCESLHIINAPFLLAKYGASGADSALETLLHQITVSSAIQGKKICIILDHLESFIPPLTTYGKNSSDSAMPTLNSICTYTSELLKDVCITLYILHLFVNTATYLSKLIYSINSKGIFPFPTKNPIYNSSHRVGYVYQVQLCIIGVVTCDDDGGRKSIGSFAQSTVLDALGYNRYRLPNTAIKNRVDILSQLMEHKGMRFDDEATDTLHSVLASADFNRRMDFFRAIIKLQSIAARNNSIVTTRDLVQVWNTHKIDKIYEPRTDDRSAIVNHQFASVGGIIQAKKDLLDALAFDKRKRLILSRFGMSPPNGVLLYGPPGNGKTLLAKAVSNLMQRKSGDNSHQNGLFISLSASEIVRSEVGKSEKLVASAFEMARRSAPAVIFIDEFQALFTSRSDGNKGTKGSGRLASVLLQCLDDLSKWSRIDEKVQQADVDEQYQRVVVLGATNTPWMIDKAFLRSGRFDRVVHVNLPNEADREAILRVHVSRVRLDKNTSTDDICKDLAKITADFSGADLAALVRSAAIRSLNEGHNKNDVSVSMRHFFEAKTLDFVHASSNKELVNKLNKWRP